VIIDPWFREQARIAMRDPALAGMGEIVEKERLHYEILGILQRDGWRDGPAFQGGTALRLCYGAPRLSEDLHFSGWPGISPERLAGLSAALKAGISATGLETYQCSAPDSIVNLFESRGDTNRIASNILGNGGMVQGWLSGRRFRADVAVRASGRARTCRSSSRARRSSGPPTARCRTEG